ncbi:low temperature requirement protein A [Rhizocola hellebori]|nr:low temperature requirement protein A [Rhizocola hellebori]
MITPIPAVKKAAWIEVYFDLVFVLAIAQVSHVVADHPGWAGLAQGLGLFAVLWWTWIGFVVFYNRYGDDRSAWQRLALIAATVPCGLAAVALPALMDGHRVAFTLSLAAARALLAVMNAVQGRDLSRRIASAYGASAIALVVSLLLPSPLWWLLWAAVIVSESLAAFAAGKPRRLSAEEQADTGKDWRKSLRLLKPTDPEYALNVPHLAERLGLFIIILLGEVVVTAGQAAVAHGDLSWPDAAGVLVLAGALWWTYFDAVARTYERLLEMSGGAPEIARSVFGAGRIIPAFAIVMIAAGLRVLLLPNPAVAGYWLVSCGIGTYLLGMRIDFDKATWARLALFMLSFPLGLLGNVVNVHVFIWLMGAWMAVCAYAASTGSRALQSQIVASQP